jgi:hypothetical protein
MTSAVNALLTILNEYSRKSDLKNWLSSVKFANEKTKDDPLRIGSSKKG